MRSDMWWQSGCTGRAGYVTAVQNVRRVHPASAFKPHDVTQGQLQFNPLKIYN
jgi:hypothetical protein